MTSSRMMYEKWYDTLSREEQIEEDYKCMCGYKLHKESDYVNEQNQLVSVMVCDSCGHVEHWVENVSGLLETKGV